MNADKLLLLQEELRGLENAATHLRFSIDQTQGLLNQQDWQPEELERLESLASRFARLSDLLMQRVMRLMTIWSSRLQARCWIAFIVLKSAGG
ncbi:MAG: hypothetical protein IPP36_02705 [Nitrosomonadales bacterium]|nr:hypothetical protein [Nitrosomonadales bacterium]